MSPVLAGTSFNATWETRKGSRKGCLICSVCIEWVYHAFAQCRLDQDCNHLLHALRIFWQWYFVFDPLGGQVRLEGLRWPEAVPVPPGRIPGHPSWGVQSCWVPGCWHFKKHRLVSWVMAGCKVSPGRFSRGGLIWHSPLVESRLTATSTRFGKAACLLTHRPTHTHVRPSVDHHRQTVFGRKGGTRKSPDSELAFFVRQIKDGHFRELGVLCHGDGLWRLLKDRTGFPGGADDKESACRAGGSGYPGLIPESGRSPGEEHGNPLQYSCLENPRGHRRLVGYCAWSCKESDMTAWLHLTLRTEHPCQLLFST